MWEQRRRGGSGHIFSHALECAKVDLLLSGGTAIFTLLWHVAKIRPVQLHMLLTAYISALFEPVIHNYPYKEALAALKTLEVFFLPGWKQLMEL